MWNCICNQNQIKSKNGGGRKLNERYIQYGNEYWIRSHANQCEKDGICLGCDVKIDEDTFHGLCDWERCPKCGNQLISCGCAWEHCDDDCGNWEEDGCNKDHAGVETHHVSHGEIIHKPVMETVYIIPDEDRSDGETMAIKSGKPISKNGVKVQPYIGSQKHNTVYLQPTKGYAEDDE